MDIGRLDGVHGPGRIEGKAAHKVTPPQGSPTPDPASRAELSQIGRLVSDAIALPDVRMDKVTEFSRLLKAGIYQSDERLLGALEKFRQEISGQ
jgi:hypothetical protein